MNPYLLRLVGGQLYSSIIWMLVCINSISSLVRIQKICSFLNLILRKILRSFHIVYSYVHCCLLLISPKIIELRNFLARYIVHVLHSFFGVSTQFLHDDFTAGNDHFSSRLSDLREILLKFIHILLILLLFFSCWEFQWLFSCRLHFAVLFFVLFHHLF